MKPIVILGAGLAGLSCAVHLTKRGKKVLVLEEKNTVGGRVSTHRTDQGFLVDEGFQVLLSSYPELSHVVSIQSLKLKPFHSGALIFDGTKLQLLANPLRHPQDSFKTICNPIANLKDKVLVLKLMLGAQKFREDAPLGDKSTLQFLIDFGFSEKFIEFFWRPFLAGVYLDTNLSLGSSYFQFLVRCFGWGAVSLPSDGMVQLPIQIAAALPQGSLRFNTRAKTWSSNEVVLESGEKIEASQVVCAFDSTPTQNEKNTENFRRVVTHYFTSSELDTLGWDKWLVLVPQKLGLHISHLALLSSVSPKYGSEGKPLLSVSVVQGKNSDLETIKKEVERVAGKSLQLEWVTTTEVHKALPVIRGETKGIEMCGGVYYCGDRWASPSINGALRSGRLAAERILAI